MDQAFQQFLGIDGIDAVYQHGEQQVVVGSVVAPGDSGYGELSICADGVGSII